MKEKTIIIKIYGQEFPLLDTIIKYIGDKRTFNAFVMDNGVFYGDYFHKEDGPITGIPYEGSYYLYGKRHTKEEWEKVIHNMEFNSALSSLLDES